MKRWLVKIAVLLVLGAIVNVAVAWSLAYRISVDDITTVTMGFTLDPQWLVIQEHHYGTHLVTVIAARRDQFLTFSQISQTTPVNDIPGWVRTTTLASRNATQFGFPAVVDIARGWPTRSLTTGIDGTFNGEYLEQFTYLDCIYLERPARSSVIGHRALPVRPIWRGFAINTIFYAAMLWLLFAAPLKLRRWRRIKRGLCPACAYPVGSNEVCTECGKRVKGAP